MTIRVAVPRGPFTGAAAEVVHRRLALLSRVSEILASSLDYETTLRQVAWLAVPELADWCAVYLVDADGSVERITVAYADPAQATLASALERADPPRPGEAPGALRVLESGSPVLFPRVGEVELACMARGPTHLQLLRRARLRSVLCVPLNARGRHVGVLALATADSGRSYTDADLALAEELACRCALAVDNARLHRETQDALHRKEESLALLDTLLAREQAARGEAEAAQRHLALLAGASELLASSLDYEATLRQIAWLAVPELADWCAVHMLESDDTARLGALAYANPAHAGLAQAFERARPVLPPRLPHVLHTGGAQVWPDISDEVLEAAAPDDETLQQLRSMGLRSKMQLPLRARGRTLGVLTLATADSGRRYGPADVALAQQLADRCAVALDNAVLVGELRRALGVREELLAATSHELRTPLAHIKGFTSSLRQPDVEWDEATRQDFLAEIEREADRLSGLIGDLLSMSRLESGVPEQYSRVATPPDALVSAGLDRVRGLLGDARVQVDVPSDLPSVVVDAAQLEQVVANLVANAAKYGPSNVQIRIAAARVGSELELAVEDDGPGIRVEDLEHVFDKFFRARSTEQSGVPGTGLGLAICRAIVQAHGGRIWAENRPAGGARLAVRLPLEASTAPGLR